MGKSAFGDEQRAAREDKVRSKHDKYRTRKTVRPVGLAVLDEGKEYASKRCQKRAGACGRLMLLPAGKVDGN